MRKRARAALAVVAAAGLLAGGSAAADTGATNATNAANATGATVHYLRPNTPDYAKSHGGGGGGSNPNLYYHGGAVERTPNVVLVFWGSQWGNNDPDALSSYLPRFLGGIGQGETWSTSTTQYCDNVATGSYACTTPTITQPASALTTTVKDEGAPAPTHPTQSDLAAEAVRIATSGSYNLSTTQFVIATASGNNSSGFGTRYCAWHSSTTTSSGQRVAYTNLPYIPDAGYSCGAGSVNPGNVLDGVSIVEGHEYAESVTDQYPNGGWLDGSGAENGDKCAWTGLGSVALNSGTYPMQPLWSNAANAGAGGCVLTS